MSPAAGLRLATWLAFAALTLAGAGWPTVSAGAEARLADDSPGEVRRHPDAEPTAKRTGSLLAVVTGFRALRGQLLLAVFDSEEGFPDNPRRAVFREVYKVKGKVVEALIPDLQPGTYAVAIHHDEDANFKMKTGLFGIPKEGYGASRDAKARFGPPKFEDARFELKAGQKLRLPIHVRYF